MKTKQFELVICSVDINQAELVVKTAKDIGVKDTTVIKGRATGEYEMQNMMGVNIQPEKGVVLIVVTKEQRRKVMQEIAQVAGLNTLANGLCFSMPIESWTGTMPKMVEPKTDKNEEKQLSLFDVKTTEKVEEKKEDKKVEDKKEDKKVEEKKESSAKENPASKSEKK